MKNLGLFAAFVCITFVSQAQFWRVSKPVQIGGTVNTFDAEESIPIFSKDSSMLYFVRTFDPKNKGGEYDQDIWYSTRNDDGTYTDCKRLKSLNNKYNNAIIGMGNNGKVMYLLNAYDGKKDFEKGIAQSSGSGKGWSKPEKITIPGLDIEGEAYGFNVSGDGKTIIISQNGPKSFGEEDLYVSEKTSSGWSKPLHMGNVINSTGFEISPFLSTSKDTLFFSSNGMGGEGDADIFYSVKQGSWTEWSVPVNLGTPINSAKFDAYFTYSGDHLYWSSNRSNVRSDIYTASILAPPPISIIASGTDITKYQGSDGRINSTTKGGVAPFTYSWSNGMTKEDIFGIPKGEYTVTVTDDLGQTASTSVTLGEPKQVVVVAAPDKSLAMTHYFGYNADKLDAENAKLIAFMNGIQSQIKKGEKVTVAIKSSASYVPTREFSSNDQLAKSRAEKIKKMLEDHFRGEGVGDKLTVEITETMVGGPLYKNDRDNVEKYQPFQFIALSTK
ncbi:MAG: SprB repeat-containing protein [Crocinitomicaceae bacterium]|nr:SprB repeat-containing protein [Crocinitomicaceae bacterium]